MSNHRRTPRVCHNVARGGRARSKRNPWMAGGVHKPQRGRDILRQFQFRHGGSAGISRPFRAPCEFARVQGFRCAPPLATLSHTVGVPFQEVPKCVRAALRFQTAAVALRAWEHVGCVIASNREHSLPQDISIAFPPPRQRLAVEGEVGEMDLVRTCRRIQPFITRSVMTTISKLQAGFSRNPIGGRGAGGSAPFQGGVAMPASSRPGPVTSPLEGGFATPPGRDCAEAGPQNMIWSPGRTSARAHWPRIWAMA